jgi:hypothetical protein
MINEPIPISGAFGEIVVTVHADADAEFLCQTLTDPIEDQKNPDPIDLRDAGMLNQDSISVLIGSAQRVRRAGGKPCPGDATVGCARRPQRQRLHHRPIGAGFLPRRFGRPAVLATRSLARTSCRQGQPGTSRRRGRRPDAP